MRVVIQRVSEASVKIDGKVNGAIGKGLLVLVGVESGDTMEELQWLVRKIIQMRIFTDSEGKMNASLEDVDGNLLVISQFTLHASTKKGNRPGFSRAASPDEAIPLYEAFIRECETVTGKKVETGIFGADMKVSLVNDGPVTITMDTRNKE